MGRRGGAGDERRRQGRGAAPGGVRLGEAAPAVGDDDGIGSGASRSGRGGKRARGEWVVGLGFRGGGEYGECGVGLLVAWVASWAEWPRGGGLCLSLFFFFVSFLFSFLYLFSFLFYSFNFCFIKYKYNS